MNVEVGVDTGVWIRSVPCPEECTPDLLFSWVTKQPEADSFKCNPSYDEY